MIWPEVSAQPALGRIMPVASLQNLGYLPVATATLFPASVLDCDLYIQRRGCSFAELYRGRTYPLELEDIERLREEGVDQLYIRLEEADSYRAYLCQSVLRDHKIPFDTRLKALREVTRVAFENAFALRDSERIVNLAGDFGRDLSNIVSDDSLLFRALFSTLEHDYCTFTHVCNVSMYSAVIGRRLGITDAKELSELASGALLHDIGMRQLPRYLFNKAGKLTPVELAMVQEHPVLGFRELEPRDDVTWGQLMMVYQHHERLDGSGYPAGISGDEIHLWAKICAVADVFDAMTCHRPHRPAFRVSEVCEHLGKHAGSRYDADVVSAWLANISETAAA